MTDQTIGIGDRPVQSADQERLGIRGVEDSFDSWADVADAFSTHIDHYARTGGGENALVGLKTEGSISLQYAGRVVYELFQNALDRADGQVSYGSMMVCLWSPMTGPRSPCDRR